MGKNNTVENFLLGNSGGKQVMDAVNGRKPPPAGPAAPDPAAATLGALAGQKEDLKKKRATQTLFTSGLGLTNDGGSASGLLGF